MMNKNDITKGIKTVYGKLWEVLSLYDVTKCYNEVPKGEAEDDIWIYMGRKIEEVRKEVNSHFLGEREIREKLHNIVDETEYFVRRYERPGVVLRWKQINQKLLYFGCEFELMDEVPEIFKEIQRGLTSISVACVPDEELIQSRKEYFEAINKKSKENNLRYTEEQIFNQELQNTLTLIFENDFSEYL